MNTGPAKKILFGQARFKLAKQDRYINSTFGFELELQQSPGKWVHVLAIYASNKRKAHIFGLLDRWLVQFDFSQIIDIRRNISPLTQAAEAQKDDAVLALATTQDGARVYGQIPDRVPQGNSRDDFAVANILKERKSATLSPATTTTTASQKPRGKSPATVLPERIAVAAVVNRECEAAAVLLSSEDAEPTANPMANSVANLVATTVAKPVAVAKPSVSITSASQTHSTDQTDRHAIAQLELIVEALKQELAEQKREHRQEMAELKREHKKDLVAVTAEMNKMKETVTLWKKEISDVRQEFQLTTAKKAKKLDADTNSACNRIEQEGNRMIKQLETAAEMGTKKLATAESTGKKTLDTIVSCSARELKSIVKQTQTQTQTPIQTHTQKRKTTREDNSDVGPEEEDEEDGEDEKDEAGVEEKEKLRLLHEAFQNIFGDSNAPIELHKPKLVKSKPVQKPKRKKAKTKNY